MAIAATAIVAVTDWFAVRSGRARLETAAKPAVMVGLIIVAMVGDADPEVARWLIVAGLACGLAGDIMLLPRVDNFLGGLGAFLVGHLFYVVGFAAMDLAGIGILGGVCAAGAILLYLGRPVFAAVWATSYRLPVVAYMAVVAGLVVFGTATHRWPIAAGGVLFAVSDGLLGLDRFVVPAPQRRWLVHALYHVGQFGIVLGLS